MPGLGDQQLSFAYDHAATASEFNKRLTDIIKPGLYKGGLLTNPSGDNVEIATFTALVRCSSDELVKVETSTAVTISVSELKPYVTYILHWQDDKDNSGDFSSKADDGLFNGSEIFSNEIVFGKAIYSGGVITGFDYTDRTRGTCDADGNIWVDSNISIKGNASIQQNATVGGNVTISQVLSCNGAINLPTAIPSSPTTGSCYFDSVTGTLYIYDGSAWLSTVLT